MREASSRVLIEELVANGATVTAYDPVAMPAAKQLLAALPGSATPIRRSRRLDGADALAIVTEWQEFRSPDFEAIRTRLKTPAIFDGRNLLRSGAAEAVRASVAHAQIAAWSCENRNPRHVPHPARSRIVLSPIASAAPDRRGCARRRSPAS